MRCINATMGTSGLKMSKQGYSKKLACCVVDLSSQSKNTFYPGQNILSTVIFYIL